MFIFQLFQDVRETAGIPGVVIVAAYVAVAVGSVLWLAGSIVRATWRAVGRWQLRRELRVLRGGKPSPLFRFYPELDDQVPGPPAKPP